MSLTTSWGVSRGRARTKAPQYRCEITWDYAAVAPSWSQLAARGSALAFQQTTWLRSWYDTVGRGADVTPLFLTVVDESGREVMGLPLVLRVVDGLRSIEFADFGLTDYNAPILAGDVLADPANVKAIWSAIRRALPPADLFSVTKMPVEVAGRANPLARLNAALPCRLSGNVLHIPDRYEEWHWGLERTFRKELERSLRVFWRAPGAAFRQIEDPAEVQRVYGELKRLQSARIAELGLPYILDEAQNEAFYDTLVRDGIADGSVILTALTTENEVVAALLGIRSGNHYAMVRLAAAGGAWRNCSPGRLVIERTMHHLHAQGLRSFDFTIGDYAYKRRLGVTAQPLVDLSVALSWRGVGRALKQRARNLLRTSPLAIKVRDLLRS